MTWYLDTPSNDSRYSRPKRPAHSLIGRQNQQFLQSTSESAFGPWNFWQCPEWPALGGMLYTLETCAAMLSLHATMGRFQYVPITLLFWTWIPQVRIRRYVMQTNYAQRNFRQVGRRSVLLLWRLVFALPYWRICRFTVYRIISQIYYRHRKLQLKLAHDLLSICIMNINEPDTWWNLWPWLTEILSHLPTNHWRWSFIQPAVMSCCQMSQ